MVHSNNLNHRSHDDALTIKETTDLVDLVTRGGHSETRKVSHTAPQSQTSTAETNTETCSAQTIIQCISRMYQTTQSYRSL